MQKEQVGILSIVCHEIYQKIPNSKWYCQKFSHATIKYEDTIIKR
jgi:hypothetical protein